MGKIPKSRKHKRMKPVDSEYLNEWSDKRTVKRKPRVDTTSNKLNILPKNPNEQEVPRKVRELMYLKKKTKEGKIRRRKFRKNAKQNDLGDIKGATRPLKPEPKFKQESDESEDAFMYRIDSEVRKRIGEAEMEDHFDMDLDGNEKQTKGKKKQKKQERLKKLKEKINNKRQDKEFTRRDKRGDFETFKDHVEFGEVAMAPPNLTARPRQVTDEKTNHPGSKSLLLKDLMANKTTPHVRAPGEVLKRKHTSMAKQSMLNKERERVVDLYRQMKKQKMESS